MIESGPYSSLPINFSFPEKLLDGTKYINHYLNGEESKINSVEEYYEFLNKNEFVDIRYGSSYVLAPCSSLSINLPNDCKQEKVKIDLPVNFFLPGIVQLDILNSLIWDRAICLTKECLNESNLIMKPFLIEEEKILKVDPKLICE